MNDGRKTRRFGGGMNEKAKEKAKRNREWQQISAVSLSCYICVYLSVYGLSLLLVVTCSLRYQSRMYYRSTHAL